MNSRDDLNTFVYKQKLRNSLLEAFLNNELHKLNINIEENESFLDDKKLDPKIQNEQVIFGTIYDDGDYKFQMHKILIGELYGGKIYNILLRFSDSIITAHDSLISFQDIGAIQDCCSIERINENRIIFNKDILIYPVLKRFLVNLN